MSSNILLVRELWKCLGFLKGLPSNRCDVVFRVLIFNSFNTVWMGFLPTKCTIST